MARKKKFEDVELDELCRQQNVDPCLMDEREEAAARERAVAARKLRQEEYDNQVQDILAFNADAVICPNGPHEMVLRYSKKAQRWFWGCSEYLSSNCHGCRRYTGPVPPPQQLPSKKQVNVKKGLLLRRTRLPVEGFQTTASSKKAVIESLSLAFEKSDIQILNDPVLMGELQSFQAEKMPGGGLRYAAPGSGHDDCVMSLGFAWSAVGGVLRAQVHPVITLWGEEFKRKQEAERPGHMVPKPTISANETARDLGEWQKAAAGFADHLPMKPFLPDAASRNPEAWDAFHNVQTRKAADLPRVPDCCPNCGNTALAQFGSFWKCVCGHTGAYNV
jgi:ssDNA-binding Zn-finger/Zn-ribbon topoisomerase 1